MKARPSCNAVMVTECLINPIAVGQWLVSGLQRPSSARQSLAAQQKELSEEHRMTLKRLKCIENTQILCNFPFFTHFFLFFFQFFLLFSLFFCFFCFFSLFFCLQVHDRDGLHDKMGLQLKALKTRLLRRWTWGCTDCTVYLIDKEDQQHQRRGRAFRDFNWRPILLCSPSLSCTWRQKNREKKRRKERK